MPRFDFISGRNPNVLIGESFLAQVFVSRLNMTFAVYVSDYLQYTVCTPAVEQLFGSGQPGIIEVSFCDNSDIHDPISCRIHALADPGRFGNNPYYVHIGSNDWERAFTGQREWIMTNIGRQRVLRFTAKEPWRCRPWGRSRVATGGRTP